jgi:hypothetical protein
MFLKILLTLVVVLIGFVAVVALRPAQYRVARTTTIAAPAPAVFAHVNDFHQWGAWNPWGKLDPAMKLGYAGTPAGARTVVTWSMTGDVNFVAKAVHLFMVMDRMIGGNFEKVLADLKSVVEAGPRADAGLRRSIQ